MTDDNLEIITPLDKAKAQAFQTFIQTETIKAIETGNLQTRSFPELNSLTIQHMLARLNSIIAQAVEIGLEIVPKNMWLERFITAIRLPLHQAILFYVKKVVLQQHAINQEFIEILKVIEQEQQKQRLIQELEIKKLQTEIYLLKQTPNNMLESQPKK